MASFPHLPVQDFPGATQNFEALLAVLNALEAKISPLETKVTALEARKNFNVGNPAGLIERATGTPYEPSATQDTLVNVRVVMKAASSGNVEFVVGAQTVGNLSNLAGAGVPTEGRMITFAVPAGKTWEGKLIEGAIQSIFSSYTFLD